LPLVKENTGPRQYRSFFGGKSLLNFALNTSSSDARDIYLITYLAFIIAASQFLYLQNILMTAYILLVCVSLFGTLICINSGSLGNVASLKVAGRIYKTYFIKVLFKRLIFGLRPRLAISKRKHRSSPISLFFWRQVTAN
jgi:hypothetical protein